MSKIRISESPAAVTRVRSFECGINLTEKILARWPVETVVASLKELGEPSVRYSWMLRCWSSEPEASSLPFFDQLLFVNAGLWD